MATVARRKIDPNTALGLKFIEGFREPVCSCGDMGLVGDFRNSILSRVNHTTKFGPKAAAKALDKFVPDNKVVRFCGDEGIKPQLEGLMFPVSSRQLSPAEVQSALEGVQKISWLNDNKQAVDLTRGPAALQDLAKAFPQNHQAGTHSAASSSTLSL